MLKKIVLQLANLQKDKESLAILAFFLSILAVKPLFAAEDEINLEQALEYFYKNNYDIIIGKFEIDKAYADFIGAKLLPNPNFTFNYLNIEHGMPPISENAQFSGRIDQLIELGGKRELRTNYAAENLEAVKLSNKDAIRNLLIGFYSLFYNLNLEMLNIDLVNDELIRFDKTLDIAEKRFNAGYLSLIDYTKIKIARIDIENNLTNLENQFRNDIEQFNLLLGSDKTQKPARIQIQEEFQKYADEGLISIAYQNRYDYLSLQRQSKASEYNLALARSFKIPNVTVGGEYDSFGPSFKPAIGLGFSLNIPLFNKNQGEILRRTAESSQIKIQMEKVRRQIASDIHQAINNYTASLNVFNSYKNRRSDMEELISKTENAFSLGGVTSLYLLDTQKAYRDFMFKYNQAVIQCSLNKELIKIYTGEIM